MVRAFDYGAIGRRIDPSCCFTTGVTKAVVYVMLSVGCILKNSCS